MYMKMWIMFVVNLSFCYCQDIPLVELSKGTVIGLKVRSEAASVDYFSFRGIPYAISPTGDLRFKAPKPALNWTGILDARQDKSACMQLEKSEQFSVPSEDCLFLNVYTPYLKVPEGKSLLPVMVYIHGGNFVKGSSDSRMYGPDFFMQEDVVLVTFNYRLGVFGFLNLEQPEVQGNAGLKDQILALKWVQKEIKTFGGNPNSVTIFGNSAGGMSVHFLYLSPLTQGLFHRAISQSGTAYSMKTINNSNYDDALKLANGLNCNATSVETVMECLKTSDAIEIVGIQENISVNNEKLRFYPTIDKNLGEEAVIPEDLRELNSKRYSTATYMLGVTKDEGIYKLKAKNYTKDMENLAMFLPTSIQQSSQQIQNEAVQKLEQFYFNNTPFSNDTIKGAIDLYTDQLLHSTIQTARSLISRATVYLYQFTFDGQIKFLDPLPLLKELNITGASHADDLGFLFYGQRLKQNISTLTDDSLTILRMVHLWTNFAKFGDPTPNSSDKTLDGVIWKPVSKTTFKHLQIGKELTMINSDLELERITFWDSFYPTSGTIKLKCNLFVVFFMSVVIIFQLLL